MEFAYHLTGPGWSEARLADGLSSATVTASYLGDALGDLLAAVVALLEGAYEARCCWAEEPGEYRWIFDGESSDLRLRVLRFPYNDCLEPDERGELVFECTAPAREMADAIARGAQRVLDEYGENEYLRRWLEHPFPLGYLQLIRAHLAAE